MANFSFSISFPNKYRPTVPHKQKIGILTGISFQFFLNKDNMDAESEYTNINGGGVFENSYNDGD